MEDLAGRLKPSLSSLAKILASAILGCSLLFAGLAAVPASGSEVFSAGLSGQSGIPVRISLRLASGAHLDSHGVGLPDDQKQHTAGQQGALGASDSVTELVTDRGHRLDLSKHNLHQAFAVGALGVRVLEVPDQAEVAAVLAELRLDPGVVWAEKTQPVFASTIPNDPYYSLEWAPAKVGLPAAWNATTGSANVTVAVVDTGLYGSIVDFAGRIVSPYSVVDGSSDATYWNDTVGHGTAVAGVAASQGNNALGIAGAAWGVKIMPVKISADGTSDDVTLSQGVVYAVDHGANVINISFGGSSGSSTMASAIDYALSHGVVVVASAGNSGPGAGVSYPAAYSGVIAVGAIDSSDTVASFSSTGSGLVLSPPGVSILTWYIAGGASALAYWNGTSFSSPLVAGVAALMLSVNPGLTPSQVTSLLEQTALDRGVSGWDQYYGYGRVQADAAVAAAGAQSPTTTTTLPANPTRYEQTNSNLVYAGSWSTLTGSSYSGGSLKYTSGARASVSIGFSGANLTWIGKTASNYGKARLTLDGGTPFLVDLYTAGILNQQALYSTGTLAVGSHTLKIEWTGQKNPSSSNTFIALDALDVVGTLTRAGAMGVGGQMLFSGSLAYVTAA